MPQIDDKHVKICGCTIVWDGITRPDKDEQTGALKYSLKLVIPPNNPDVALFDQLASTTLQYSEFRGVLPAGGFMPVGVTKPGEFNDLFPGFSVISAKSNYVPDVYDEAGVPLDPMVFTPMLYPGQLVDVLVHCYAYNKKSKGIGAGLDAFSITASANAPRQDFSGNRIQTAHAFGQGPGMTPYQQQPAAPTMQPLAQQPLVQQQPYMPVQQQPPQTTAPAAGGYGPQTTAPATPPAQPVIVGYDQTTGQPIYQQ